MSLDQLVYIIRHLSTQAHRMLIKICFAEKYQTLDDSQRYLIAIAGIPGSGKSTFASGLAFHLNKLFQGDYYKQYPNAPDYGLSKPRTNNNGANRRRNLSDPTSPEIAYVLPMDGFHLTRAQLSAMPDPEEAHYRRGAAFTFDADSYLKLIEKLRKPIEPTTNTIRAPSFDHAIKDPVENDIGIPRSARVIIVEGLYTALSYAPEKTESADEHVQALVSSSWTEACSLMDEIWLIEVSVPVATERVARRNFKAGLSPSLEAAVERTINNDMKNAREILDNLPADEKLTERIQSIDDEEWKSAELKSSLEDQERLAEEEHEEIETKRLRLERMGSIAEMVDAGVGM